ncbi:MAG TPA: enoyl-CoA hydratase/isomerase family protein, partial [Acidimicrobiales bacterium]|nr:enoyl-CoA hydratase/isomerase family protein [Acidimicrobiales bacterium]
MDDDPVLLEVDGGVAVVTLNRPERHNALDDAADALLHRYLDLLRSDRAVRAVVWRAEGGSFSTGRDVAELLGEPGPGPVGAGGDGTNGGGAGGANGAGGDGAASAVGTALLRRALAPNPFEQLDRSQWVARLLADFPVPIVCALKGWTLGTAFERALLCDIRVAGESAKMALS